MFIKFINGIFIRFKAKQHIYNALTKLTAAGLGSSILLTSFTLMLNKTELNTLEKAIGISEDLLIRIKDESGCPGITIAVGINGKSIWEKGIGYSDVENRIECKPDTVMRIASISKSMTMSIAGKLKQQNLLDYDAPIEKYVKSWPKKMFNSKPVSITTRQLVSHLGGVRHYSKCGSLNSSNGCKESELEEFYITANYKSVDESLGIFKDDNLCSEPGTEYLYTTYGWTLVSAVLEGASGEKFERLANDFFHELGLKNTYLDEADKIIYHRSRDYIRNKENGKLNNAPCVNNSHKWAGGGILSTASDLIKFAFATLKCLHDNNNSTNKTYLSKDTIDEIFRPVPKTKCAWDKDGIYAMGWCLSQNKVDGNRIISHTGGSVGTSSVLLIAPTKNVKDGTEQGIPFDVSVAIIGNMASVSLYNTAIEIAKAFQNIDPNSFNLPEKKKSNFNQDLQEILWHTPRHDD